MAKSTLNSLYGATLPPKSGTMKVLRIGKDEQAELICLSHVVDLFGGHWVGNKTVACQQDPSVCPHHLAEAPYRVYGFVHVLHFHQQKEYVLMLTADGVHNLQDIAEREGRLRGLHVLAARQHKSITQPVVFALKGKFDPSKLGIPAKDVQPSIRRIWHFEGVVDPRAVRG